MSTRSLIGLLQKDNSVNYIYVHWDGYTTGNGLELLEKYKTKQQVEKLLELGSMSSLPNANGSSAYGDDPKKNADLDYFVNKDGRGATEYHYLFDPNKNLWSVASCHFPIAKKEYDDLEKVFNRGFYSNDADLAIPYDEEKKIIEHSVYGEYKAKLYPLNMMIAYEIYHQQKFHLSNSKYSKYLEDDNNILKYCLENQIFDRNLYKAVQNLDEIFEPIRLAGLVQIKKIAEKRLNEIEAFNNECFNKLKAVTEHYDLKATAKLIKKALVKAGYKKLSVTTSYYGISIEDKHDTPFTQKEVDYINNEILKEFNDQHEEYIKACNKCTELNFDQPLHFIDYDFSGKSAVYFQPYNIVEE